MIGLLAAIRLLTILPIPQVSRAPLRFSQDARGSTREHVLGAAVAFFPTVGVGLGLVLVAADVLLSHLVPPGVASSIILAGWVVLTGALHVDGFMDSCDGLLIHADRERRLEIMSDSRVGGFGVVGGALLLLTKYSALVTLANWARPVALIMAPTLGRAAMSLAILAFPSARREGMGYLIKTQARWHHAALAVGQAAVVSALAGGMLGLMFAAIAGLATLGLGAWMNSRLNGLTGDTYGALAESVELLVLLTLTVKGVW